jgi:hypothetical protein
VNEKMDYTILLVALALGFGFLFGAKIQAYYDNEKVK